MGRTAVGEGGEEVIEFIAGLVAGNIIGAGAAISAQWRAGRRRAQPQNTDYKERWQSAVDLLASGGQVTAEQLAAIRGEKPAATPSYGSLTPASDVLKALHSMNSSHRCELEVERAQNGLPPLDDLWSMNSSHKRERERSSKPGSGTARPA